MAIEADCWHCASCAGATTQAQTQAHRHSAVPPALSAAVPAQLSVPAAAASTVANLIQPGAGREPIEDRAAVRALDEISDDEQWLWRLVNEADKVSAAAPPKPDPKRLAEIERSYAIVRQAEERVLNRIRATEAALARPDSWLRLAHRAALTRHLREDRAAAVATAVQRGRVEEVLSRLRSIANDYSHYLTQHHAALAAGQNARAELERIFDDLIDGYARLAEPPAWFRFGLGYPPPPGAQPEWLARARQALGQRRRLALEQPTW